MAKQKTFDIGDELIGHRTKVQAESSEAITKLLKNSKRSDLL